jgi:hypothetical protein
VVLAGAIEGDSFDATLTRSGLTWKGTAPVDDYWEDCVDSNKYEKTKLLITIVVTQAGPDTEKHWSVSAFTGSATWEIPDTEQCQSAVYQMDVSVPYPYAGG